MGSSRQGNRFRTIGHGCHRALGVEQVILARPKAEADQRARIRNSFALPAVIRLELAHGIFASLVPGSGGLAFQIVLADQSFLNRLCPLGVDLLLTTSPRRLLVRTLSRGRGMSLARGFLSGG